MDQTNIGTSTGMRQVFTQQRTFLDEIQKFESRPDMLDPGTPSGSTLSENEYKKKRIQEQLLMFLRTQKNIIDEQEGFLAGQERDPRLANNSVVRGIRNLDQDAINFA